MQKYLTAALLAVLAAGLLAASAFAAAPGNTAPPTVTGTPQVGETLTDVERNLDRLSDELLLPLAALHRRDLHEHCRRECAVLRRRLG